MSAMADMSRAIRVTIQQHAPTLQELDDGTLKDFADIVGAFAMDLREEVNLRRDTLAAITAPSVT